MAAQVTREFPITAGNGDVYHVQELTDDKGNTTLQTADGEEVKYEGDGLYSIPSLKVSGVTN